MRTTILYIAMSLDGFIADEANHVDWLHVDNPSYHGDYGYGVLMERVDTIVMGKRTYDHITTELSKDAWPYPNHITYVVSHHQQEDSEHIHFVNEDAANLIAGLKQQRGKDIWICGGANIAQALQKEQAIDEYQLTIMPLLLGKGIPLFHLHTSTHHLQLLDSQHYGNVIELRYKKK